MINLPQVEGSDTCLQNTEEKPEKPHPVQSLLSTALCQRHLVVLQHIAKDPKQSSLAQWSINGGQTT